MKSCNVCNKEKDLTDFRARDRNKNGIIYYHTKCKSCENEDSKARHKRYYAARPDYHRAKTIAAKIPNKLKVIEYLKTHSCVDCGNSDFRVLEFDHRNPEDKLEAISSLLRKGRPWEVIESEIAKCDVRCANCHRIKTATDYDFYGYLFTDKEVNFESVLDWYTTERPKSKTWHSRKKC
jgi:hypothetical protein